jgi:predicted nucleotidyltransferase
MDINSTILDILGLYRGQYRSSIHIREAARQIGISVEAVRIQLNRLEQARVITGLRRGSLKEYALNFNNFSTIYYLIISETYETIRFLDEYFVIKKVIEELGDILQGIVILFGSFAKKQARETSDIDLFVIGDRPIDQQAVINLGDLIGRDINIKYATAQQFTTGLIRNSPLEQEVIANYIVLKGVESFCDLLWRLYANN